MVAKRDSVRGSVLIFSLLLVSLFLVMGIGFLSQRAAQNRAARASQAKVQARAVAEAGLADVATKFAKRSDFPPLSDDAQRVFRYTEILTDEGGAEVGTYVVSVDMTRSGKPYWIARLLSTGRVSVSGAEPVAESTLSAELDLSEFIRGSVPKKPEDNPNRYRFLFVSEGRLD